MLEGEQGACLEERSGIQLYESSTPYEYRREARQKHAPADSRNGTAEPPLHLVMGGKRPAQTLSRLGGNLEPTTRRMCKVIKTTHSRFVLHDKKCKLAGYQCFAPAANQLESGAITQQRPHCGSSGFTKRQQFHQHLASIPQKFYPHVTGEYVYWWASTGNHRQPVKRQREDPDFSSSNTSFRDDKPSRLTKNKKAQRRRKSQKKVITSDQALLHCCFCDKRYDTLSALSLHLRLKHYQLVRIMMDVAPNQQLQAIHGRSVAAFVNNCMKPSYTYPKISADEAMKKLCKDNLPCNLMFDSEVIHVLSCAEAST